MSQEQKEEATRRSRYLQNVFDPDDDVAGKEDFDNIEKEDEWDWQQEKGVASPKLNKAKTLLDGGIKLQEKGIKPTRLCYVEGHFTRPHINPENTHLLKQDFPARFYLNERIIYTVALDQVGTNPRQQTSLISFFLWSKEIENGKNILSRFSGFPNLKKYRLKGTNAQISYRESPEWLRSLYDKE